MASGFANVKEVLSGDTLVLIGQPKNGPPPEIRLTLASLQAPRIGTFGKNGETKDEPFAWQAREFLRQQCIGKYVSFKVEYTVPSINRQFGSVRLNTGAKENLCVVVASRGWARVKTGGDEKERSADYDQMVHLSGLAEKQGLGVFNPDTSNSIRQVTYEVANTAAFLEPIKGKPQRAVIEYVRDGGSFKILLVDSMTYCTFNLAGVQCPKLNMGGGEAPEPFAREAKYFTEIRLLNRDVNVIINGCDDRHGSLYGSIDHPAGDISVELIKNGLARPVDWSMHHTTFEKAAAMRAAARDAKANKLRIWRNFVAPKISGDKVYAGVVAEIVSGDTMVVRVGNADQIANRPWECEERRISLSSIRAPRLGTRSRPEDAQPYSEEAKELLRNRCLGKKCEVSVEYERQPAEGATGLAAQPRKYGTVTVHLRKGSKNAAALVLEEGFAELMRHRADDERSAHYDDLQLIQANAQAAEKGIFCKAPKPPTERPVDLTGNSQMAKAHFATLQAPKPGRRTGFHKAIVEYLHNASRFRVYLPQENVVMNFALGGIRTPETARPAMNGRAATSAEPLSKESLVYSRSLVLQREVQLEIETQDKGGTCIGQMSFKKGSDRLNLGVVLIKTGLAYVNDFSVKYASCGEELQREQAEAQSKKLGIWEKYEAPKADANGSGAAWGTSGGKGNNNGDKKLGSTTVCISEIVCGNVFFMQNQNASTKAALDGIEKELAAIDGVTPGGPGTGIIEPKRNMNCLALFDDGSGHKWFRAKVLGIKADDKGVEHVHVRYIDYGNEEVLKMDRLRSPPSLSLFSSPPIAQECELAFVKVPGLDKEYGQEAAMCLSDLVYGKQVTAKLHGKSEGNRLLVSLFSKEEGKPDGELQNVAAVLLKSGLGYVDSKAIRYLKSQEENDMVALLKKEQESAHSEHVNLWRYGDPREDE